MRDDPEAQRGEAPPARGRRRAALFWAALTLIGLGGVLAVHWAAGPARSRYRFERIDRGPIRSEVTVPGTVSALTTVPVASPVSGTVTKIYADVNEVVQRGQLLAQLDAARATIRAPITGVIVSRNVDVGRHVGPRRVVVFTMTRDLSRIQVRATVSEADVGRVAVGEGATLRWEACPGCALAGTVSEVRASPRLSRGVASRTVLVEADNRDQKLLPGMAATVSIEVAHRDDVLRLPFDALGFVLPGMEPAGSTDSRVGRVFVLDHGRPRPLRVTVGLEDRRYAELVAGPLREGDAVIVGQNR